MQLMHSNSLDATYLQLLRHSPQRNESSFQAAEKVVPYLDDVAGLAVLLVDIALKAKHNKQAIRTLSDEVTRIANEVTKCAGPDKGMDDTAYRDLFLLVKEIHTYVLLLETRGTLFRLIHGEQDAETLLEFQSRLRCELDVLGVRSHITITKMHETVIDIDQNLRKLSQSVVPLLKVTDNQTLRNICSASNPVKRSQQTSWDFSGATINNSQITTIEGDYTISSITTIHKGSCPRSSKTVRITAR